MILAVLVCEQRLPLPPPVQAYSGIVTIKMHKGLESRDVTNESLNYIASQWMSSCLLKVLCMLIGR